LVSYVDISPKFIDLAGGGSEAGHFDGESISLLTDKDESFTNSFG